MYISNPYHLLVQKLLREIATLSCTLPIGASQFHGTPKTKITTKEIVNWMRGCNVKKMSTEGRCGIKRMIVYYLHMAVYGENFQMKTRLYEHIDHIRACLRPWFVVYSPKISLLCPRLRCAWAVQHMNAQSCVAAYTTLCQLYTRDVQKVSSGAPSKIGMQPIK